MNPRIRMLIWEQSRTAGVLCSVIGAMTLLVLVALRTGFLGYTTHMYEVFESAAVVVGAALLLASATLLTRQDVNAHLSLDFEPRLLYLPTPILPVALIAFAARLLALLMLGLALHLCYRLLFSEALSLDSLVVALNIYAVAQALTWSRRSVTGLYYALPLALLLLSTALLLIGVNRETLAYIAETAGRFLVHPASVVFVAAASFALSGLGVVWERQEIRRGLPPVDVLYDWLSTIQAAQARTFESPFEAQLWFEQRRIGRLLPLFTLLFTLLFGVVFTLLPGIAFTENTRYWQTPLVSLLAAALIVGRIGLRPRGKFAVQRPQTEARMAMALILIHLRSLFVSFIIIAVLSTLGMLLHGADGVLFVQMLAQGDMSLVEAAVLMLRPAFAYAIIAWVLLWVSALPLLIPTILIAGYGILGITMEHSQFHELVNFLEDIGVMVPVILLIALALAVATAAVMRQRLFSRKHIFIGVLLFQNLTLLFLVLTPEVGWHFYGLTACATLAAALLLPLPAAPLSLSWYKHKG